MDILQKEIQMSDLKKYIANRKEIDSAYVCFSGKAVIENKEKVNSVVPLHLQ
jgi:hypothetical protein